MITPGAAWFIHTVDHPVITPPNLHIMYCFLQMREVDEVDALAARLEKAGGGNISLTWTTTESSPDQSSMELLAGTWRLIYRCSAAG